MTGRGLPKKILAAGLHRRVWLISGASGQGAGTRDTGVSLGRDLEVRSIFGPWRDSVSGVGGVKRGEEGRDEDVRS